MIRVEKIAECDGIRGACFHAGGDVSIFRDFFLPLEGRLLLGPLEPIVAEGALFHDAAHTHRNIGVEHLAHASRPFSIKPVKVSHMIGAGRHAVPAADAAIL